MSFGILNRPTDGGSAAAAGLNAKAETGLGVPVFRPAGNKPPNATVHPDATTPALVPEPIDLRTLVVGRGIRLQGIVADAERLVVEGMVDSKMIEATELMVAAGGLCRGEIVVDVAHIAGTFEGSITARKRLVIRSSGVVTGIIRYVRLSVEEGGQLSAQAEILAEAPTKPPFQPAPAVEPGD